MYCASKSYCFKMLPRIACRRLQAVGKSVIHSKNHSGFPKRTLQCLVNLLLTGTRQLADASEYVLCSFRRCLNIAFSLIAGGPERSQVIPIICPTLTPHCWQIYRFAPMSHKAVTEKWNFRIGLFQSMPEKPRSDANSDIQALVQIDSAIQSDDPQMPPAKFWQNVLVNSWWNSR